MKRWQSKKEKWLMGCLFLLIASSYISWNSNSKNQTGWNTLSSMVKPKGFVAPSSTSPKPKKSEVQGEDTRDSEFKSSEEVEKEVVVENTERIESTDSKNSVTRWKVQLGDKTVQATYQVSDTDKSKTLVTITPIPTSTTEAQGPCHECKTYEVDIPLDQGNLENLVKINAAIQKNIDQSAPKKDPVPVSVAQRSHDEILRDRNKVREREDDSSDPKNDEDPFDKACGQKRSRDATTLCYMKELGRLARIHGDDAYDSSELMDLFDKRIFKNLKTQLEDRAKSSRQDDAKIAIANLIEKLDDSNGESLRGILTKMSHIPLVIAVNDAAKAELESRELAKVDPARAYRKLNEFQMKRWNIERTFQTDLSDSSLLYESLVGDRISREQAMSEFYDNFVDPLRPYHDALWSNDPFGTLQSSQGLYQPQSFNSGSRSLRDQMGRNGFSTSDPNSRSFPRGPQINSRFAGTEQPRSTGPNQFGPSPGNQSGSFNRGIYQPGINSSSGLTSRFSTPNTVAPYQSAPVSWQPNSYTSPGYMGRNGPSLGAPVLNGSNYYTGYADTLANPFSYRPTNSTQFSYQGSQFFQSPYPVQGPGMPGGTGMTGARPRF